VVTRIFFSFVEGDLRFRLAKIVAPGLLSGDVNRIIDLLEIDSTDYIKGRHGSISGITNFNCWVIPQLLPKLFQTSKCHSRMLLAGIQTNL
jgi:hypothetical protein